MSKILKIIWLFFLSVTLCNGQENTNEKEYITKTFGGIYIVNMPTTEIGPAKSFNFIIQHRFGASEFNNEILKNFMGIDLVSNIRFALAFPIKERVLLSVGRTRYKKHYDFDVKYTFLKQTTSNSTPFSASLRFNTAVMSDRFSPIPEDYFYSSGEPFNNYKEMHRLSYTTQLILARKFSNAFSFQVAPAFIHRNLVGETEENNIIAIPAGGKIKTGLFSSVIFEFAYIHNKPEDVLYPYSIGWQKETASHVFQLFVSTSNRILDFSNYTNENQVKINEGKFFLGFNLNKKLWIKK